ncbi:hypothetical protein, partial [Burkholderia mallei]|uniref:hypothetical protein n=3 Tax=Burkholderia mallei TaxID=13373 RepID=UPI001E65902C
MTVLIQPPVQTTLIVRRWRMTLDSRHFQLTKRQSPVNTGLQIADKPSPSGGFLFFNGVMLKTPMPTQHELEMVTLEELVP